MGTRGLSDLTAMVRNYTMEINGSTARLRMANKRLTGTTGEAPTAPSVQHGETKLAEVRPLIQDLDAAIDALNNARIDLMNEVSCLEALSETAGVEAQGGLYSAQVGTADVGYATPSYQNQAKARSTY